MASSEEEVDDFPENVSEYHFEDDKKEPISFDVLPVCWNTSEPVQVSGNTIYVRGKADNGLSQLCKPVKAWKFDISGQKPLISVLSGNKWINLQKPRISYEAFCRTVLITVNFLYLVKRNPELHGKDLWDKLSKILRFSDDRPSPDDLVDHKALIEKAVEHYDSLKRSKYLMSCLVKNLHKRNKDQENARGKGKNAFIVDDDDLEECGFVAGKDGSSDRDAGSGDEEDDDDDMFDSVCSICDEGGSILCCDGICMRSFHATPRAAREADSKCISLGFTSKEVEAMQTFKCQNCQHKLHQCYSCGKLGSSDKESGAAEVFQCVNATCGYFYHPGCVASRLHRDNEDASKALQKNIAAGELFTCPLHVCFVCRLPEDKRDSELRMAVCRRCPKAYHKKCLPRKIAFEDDEDEGIVQRAWDNLLADRILIYCLKHEIDEDLGTPPRNHIKFPGDEKKESQSFTLLVMNHNVLKNKKPSVAHSRLGPTLEPRRTLMGNNPGKADRKISNSKGTDTLRNTSFEKKSVPTKVEHKNTEQLDLVKPKTFGKHAMKNSVVSLDSDSQIRILEIIKTASSTVTLDDVIAKHEKLISSQAYKQKMDPCKNITRGKVEGFCKAVRAANVKLDEGGNIEDAKAICEPKILDQVVKWKSKLKVYLAPFIYGMRYTSFGRHFTNKDKLIEIVEKIHSYVKSNDMIVDFCCGANDFSWFMKEKLESTGKTCNYKNFDRFPPKNDFCFEMRDWMTVQPKELPDGSKLIMGLNPPFGVKASLANQFINKALEFKPKLLILIVPEETERLDKKKTPYDLIWEDRGKLSGKSFYLPGSIDANDNQMDDWNVRPPILYLWSRSDWTATHMDVANKHGHRHGRERDRCNHPNRNPNRPVPERSSEKSEHVAQTKADNVSVFPAEADCPKEILVGEKQTAQKERLESKNVRGNLRKKRHSEEIHAKERVESFREYKHPRFSPIDSHEGWPHQVPVNASDANLSSPVSYQRPPPRNIDRDPSMLPFEPTSKGNGTYSRESQPLGFEHDYFNPSTSYGGLQSGYTTTGGRYDNRVGIHASEMDVHPRDRYSVDVGPHLDYPPRVMPTQPDYYSRVHGERTPAYMSEPEHRFRQLTFPSETDYRTTLMPGMDEYDHRFRDANHATLSGFDPHLGRPSGPGLYNQAQMQGYHGGPMGFASRPMGPFHHPHGSSGSGGWIDD